MLWRMRTVRETGSSITSSLDAGRKEAEAPEPLLQALSLGSMRKGGAGLVSSGHRTLHRLPSAAGRD